MVEDDAQVRDLTVTALSYCVNRKVVSFDNAMTAWEYINSGNEVDIVISDVDMPNVSGFELMNRVRKQYPDKIFIIMSGISDYEQVSKKQGADAFLAKPFAINDLFHLVQCFVVD